MLAILTFAKRSKIEFTNSFYWRIKWITFLCSIVFFAGLLTHTLLSAPLEDLSGVVVAWYLTIYYSVFGGTGNDGGSSCGGNHHTLFCGSPYHQPVESARSEEKGGRN
jgi:hypothetical protein